MRGCCLNNRSSRRKSTHTLLVILTCFQLRSDPAGSFFHLLTKRTQALHISPCRGSANLKHFMKSSSYFLLSVNLELITNIQRAAEHHPDGNLPARLSLTNTASSRWSIYLRSMEGKHDGAGSVAPRLIKICKEKNILKRSIYHNFHRF